MKVDNHIHLAAAMTPRMLLQPFGPHEGRIFFFAGDLKTGGRRVSLFCFAASLLIGVVDGKKGVPFLFC